MAILTVQEIIEAKDITEKDVPVPEWGGEVRVRSISHREMKNIKKKIAESKDVGDVNDDDIEKWVLIKGMIEPQITEEEYDHLLEKSTSSITTVLTAILNNSNTNEEAVKEEERTFPDGPVGILPVPFGGEDAPDSPRTPDRGETAS